MFSHDKDSMPRSWTGNEDVRAIAKEARSTVQDSRPSNMMTNKYPLVLLLITLTLMLQALKLLSVLVVIRWDDKPDRIENILTSTLLDGSVESKSSSASSGDPLASTTWEEVALCLFVLHAAKNGSAYTEDPSLCRTIETGSSKAYAYYSSSVQVSVEAVPIRN